MNDEAAPVNKTPPDDATLGEVLEEEYAKIVGNNDPDAHLKREKVPTPAQRSHRDHTVKNPETLN